MLEVCEPLNDHFKGNGSDEEYLEMKSKESVSLYFVFVVCIDLILKNVVFPSVSFQKLLILLPYFQESWKMNIELSWVTKIAKI